MTKKILFFLGAQRNNRLLYFFAFVSLLLILYSYHGLTKSFYQQDEWMTVGFIKGGGLKSFISSYSLPQIVSGQGRVLALPLTYLFFDLLAFKVIPITIFAAIVHLFNSILVFLVIRKLSKNIFISFISGLFFSAAFISHQSLSWFAAVTTTLPAAFFALLSLLFYLDFLEDRKHRSVFLSSIFLIVSLNFKESALFLIPFYPLYYLIAERNKFSLSKFLRFHWLILGYGLLIFLSRASLIAKPAGTGVAVTDSPLVVEKIISHLLIYPIASLSQIFLYPPRLYSLAETLQKVSYPFINSSSLSQLTAQTLTSEMISIYVSFFLITLTLLITIFYKDLRKICFFTIGYTLLATLPYIIFDKSTAYFETRFYYLIVPGGALLFGIFFEVLRRILASLRVKPRNALLITILISLVFIARQSFFIRKDIERDIKIASQRISFIRDLIFKFPSIGKKTVFYIDGDTDYSGVKIPFQQGPGYTLMVLYFDSGNIPKEFVASNFLWGMTEQGYKKEGDFAFGYFWDYEKLREGIRKKTFSVDEVFSLYYRGKSEELVDTTERIRKELKYQLQ